METELLELEALANSIIEVLNKEKSDVCAMRYPCMQIVREYYLNDTNKYETILAMIKEREKNGRQNRKSGVSRRNNK